jgi:hypothetical protein
LDRFDLMSPFILMSERCCHSLRNSYDDNLLIELILFSKAENLAVLN